MAAQGFLVRLNGITRQLFGIITSAGAADSGKLVALGPSGTLDNSVMPAGITPNQVVAPGSEALSAGNFVNLWTNAGVLNLRKADNSNGRDAWGYVNAVTASGATATAYRLGTVNANLTGLTIGGDYWLGTAGGVIAAPLDSTNAANVNKIDQYLGRAKSATELVTVEQGSVTL